MAASQETFYEVLGVRREAQLPELTRAYARFVAEMRKESTAPNAPLEALMKVAYETLADPSRRAEYDASLKRPAPPPVAAPVARRAPSGNRVMLGIGCAVAVAVIAAGYWLMSASFVRKPSLAAKSMDVGLLLATVAPSIGTVSGALMTGEVRDLGVAVAIGEGEMAIPCPGLAAGMALTAQVAGADLRAQISNARDDLMVCTLTVGGVHGGMKMRTATPPAQEPLQAILLAKGTPQAVPVTVLRSIQDPKGPAFAIKAPVPLPNGTPLFDGQGQLTGAVVAPHAFGDGVIAALGVGRLQGARSAAAPGTSSVFASPPVVAPDSAASPSPPIEPAPVIAPSIAPRGLGTKTGEGFSTLWKERDDGGTIEVLDAVTKGKVGLPISYWTSWTGRDTRRDRQLHCLVTFGDDGEAVADYDQVTLDSPADGYRTCGLTRFQVNLDDLEAGEYHFTIFVDGKAVSQASARLERRIVTPFRAIVVVLLLGVLLLRWARRRREG